jgi:hypothetical protein
MTTPDDPWQPYPQRPHAGQSQPGWDPYYQQQPGAPGQGYYYQQQPEAPGQGYYQQQPGPRGQGYRTPHPDYGYLPPPPPQASPRRGQAYRPPRRKKRVFLWVFLAIQVIFVIWLIAGIATKPGGQSVAQQVAQACGHGGWSPLFKSHADCVKHYAVALNVATDTGKGIGVAIVVLIWVVVDFFLGVGYGVYKLATR